MNNVKLQGIINRIYNGTGTTIVTLYIKREGRYGDEPVYDYPEVYFHGRRREVIEKFKKGDFVSISGRITSVKRYNPKTGNNELIQSIEGEFIDFAKNKMSKVFASCDAKAPCDFINEVYLEGSLLHLGFKELNNGREMMSILIRPLGSDQNIYCVDFGNVEKYEGVYQKDVVCLNCAISTKRVEKEDGSVRYYKSIVIKNAGRSNIPKEEPDAVR